MESDVRVWRNTSQFTSRTILKVARFVTPPDTTSYDVVGERTRTSMLRCGAFQHGTSKWGRSRVRTRPLVVLRIGPDWMFPGVIVPTTSQHLAVSVATATDAMVFGLAHEARHVWQYGQREVPVEQWEEDADIWGVTALRRWYGTQGRTLP